MRRAALLAVAAALLVAAGEPVPLDEETEHVVQPGETLFGIANRAKVPRVLIAEANGLKPPYVLRAGETLTIPRTRRHKVMRGDTGFSVAYRHGVPWRDIAVANGIEEDAAIRPGQVLLIPTIIAPPALRFAWPVSGPVRRGFTPRDERDHHDGLDIRVSLARLADEQPLPRVEPVGAVQEAFV